MNINLKCKQCEKDFDFEYETFVDVSQNPEFKEKLMAGQAFVKMCECGAPQVIQYSILYKNPELKYAIAMAPPIQFDASKPEEKPVEHVQAVLDDGTYTMRLVENSNDLAEKIIIFDNGYDDRIIEMVKIYYYDAIREQLEEDNTELTDMLFGVEDGQGSFWLRLADGRSMSLDLDMDMYNDIKKDMEDKIDELTPEGFGIVNPQWAYKTLSGEKEQ